MSTKLWADPYESIVGPVYGLASALLQDQTKAEEVARAVLVEVWARAADFTTANTSARAWICGLAHRRAVDRLRMERESGSKHDGDSTAHGDARAIGEWESAVDGPRPTPSDLQSRIFELAYFGGYTYQQIAAFVGVPHDEVRVLLRDGFLQRG